jgi:hypothetical protein
MPSEPEVIANLSEGDYRWYELWSFQINQLDQKAGIIVTLDGILLALTASFLSTVISTPIPTPPKAVFAVSTVLVLFSAGACTRVIWVKFWGSKMIAAHGNIDDAYAALDYSRTRKARRLHLAIVSLLGALTGYAISIILLLIQPK